MFGTQVIDCVKKTFDPKRATVVIGSVDFICTLLFGISLPFIYQDIYGIIWCITILTADLCLLYGVKHTNYKYVVIWLIIFTLNITFLLLLLPIIPMMIVAIYLGDKAIEKCYKNEGYGGYPTEWLFQTEDGIHLDCDQAKDFFRGLKGIMYIFMTIILILPVYYVFAWIKVNQFRIRCASSYQLIP